MNEKAVRRLTDEQLMMRALYRLLDRMLSTMAPGATAEDRALLRELYGRGFPEIDGAEATDD